MSKKSRRRNKRLLALAGLAGAVALSRRKNRANSITDNEAKESGMDIGVKDSPKIASPKSTVVNTPTTIMDSMPAAPKKNPYSKRIKKNTNEVYTIKGGNTGVGNTKSVFKGADGYLRRGENATPMTPGRFGTFKADQEMKRGKLPPQLRTQEPSFLKKVFPQSNFKSGGRAKLKSGGKVRGCGIAKRGLGRAMKKGKR